jgi:hypothetical protein
LERRETCLEQRQGDETACGLRLLALQVIDADPARHVSGSKPTVSVAENWSGVLWSGLLRRS